MKDNQLMTLFSGKLYLYTILYHNLSLNKK